MVQISPVGNNNPFSMFKMVDPSMSASAAPIKGVQNVKQPVSTPASAAPSDNLTDAKSNVLTRVKKPNIKINARTVAMGAAVVALAGGILYAFATRKTTFFRGRMRTPSPVGNLGNVNNLQNLTPPIKPSAEAAQEVVQNLTPPIKPSAEVCREVMEDSKVVNNQVKSIPKQVADKFKDVGFVLAAFGVGLVVRAFKEIAATNDTKAAKLQNQVLEMESYIKNIEIPYIEQEAAEYYDNYMQDITGVVDYFDLKADSLRYMYNNAVLEYDKLREGSYVEYYENTDRKKLVVKRRKNGSTRVENYDKDKCRVVNYDKNGSPFSIELYMGEKLALKGRYKFSDDKQKPYLSQMLVYTRGSRRPSLIAFNEEAKPEFYLARNNDGGLIKAFDIDSKTLDVKTVILPDQNGEKWLKMYSYTNNGILKSVSVMPSNGLPARKYNYDEGVVRSMDLYENFNEAPVLHVPFVDLNQSEFIEK